MKITTLIVVDDKGLEHRWEGVAGHVGVRSTGKLGQPYQQAVTAHLLLAADPEVKA